MPGPLQCSALCRKFTQRTTVFQFSNRILAPCNYCHHPWCVGHKSFHKALIIMFGCDGISDHASWNEIFHYWDTKLSCTGQIWRWHVKCKTVLIWKVANFTEKDWCGLHGLALTDWEVILYKLNFILWEVMLTLMPLRAARLAAHKWHQIQSIELFLVHHMNTKDRGVSPYKNQPLCKL